MTRSFLSTKLLALVGGMLTLTALQPAAHAQVYGQPQQPRVQRENVQAAGTIKQLGSAGIHLVTDAGDQWLVQPDPQRFTGRFSGTGDGTIVKQGQWVNFNTKLTKRGAATEPLGSMSIFTPGQMDFIGVASEASLAGGSGSNVNEFFSDKKPEEKPKAPPKEDENTVYRVAGQISRISRLGELTINAGGSNITAKLADNAKISVDVADLGWLQAGDKLEIRGWTVAGQKGQAWATELTASAANPLTDPKKKPKPLPMATPGGDQPAGEKPAEGTKPAAEGEKKPAEGEKKAE